MAKWEEDRAKLIEATKTNPYIIPALIIAAAILVGSWMVVQSNKAEAEKAAQQRALIEHRQRLIQRQISWDIENARGDAEFHRSQEALQKMIDP